MGFLANIEFEDNGITFTNKGTERIHNAYEIDPEGFRAAWIKHGVLGELQFEIMTEADNNSVDESIFHDKSAYLVYDWLEVHIRERALISGYKAEYMVGKSLLRTCLEARMMGILMNSLPDNEFRKTFLDELDKRDTEELQRVFGASNPWELFTEVQSQEIDSTVTVLDIIEETENIPFHNIHNGIVRDILGEYGCFEPKSAIDICSCYSNLNSSIHANIYESQMHHSLQGSGDLFESPSHSQEGFEDFLGAYFTVLDIQGVMVLNEFMPIILEDEDLKSDLSKFISKLSVLEDTRKKLETISNA